MYKEEAYHGSIEVTNRFIYAVKIATPWKCNLHCVDLNYSIHNNVELGFEVWNNNIDKRKGKLALWCQPN